VITDLFKVVDRIEHKIEDGVFCTMRYDCGQSAAAKDEAQ